MVSWSRLVPGHTSVFLIYTVVSISAVQHSDPVIHLYIYIHILFLIFSSIMVYAKRLDIVPCAVL